MDIEEDEATPERSDLTTTLPNLPNLPSMKRAPSDSTVNDSLFSKSAWERSQSEANLETLDGSNVVKDSASHTGAGNTRSKVSENARVYWDLPRAVEQGNAQQTSNPGSRVVLETIHQREELKHFSSSSESLTRFQHSSQASSEQIYDPDQRRSCSTDGSSMHTLPHGKSRSSAYTRSCIRSCERLSLSLEGDGETDEDSEMRRTNIGRRVHVVHRLYHSDNDEDSTMNVDDNSCNYFCDSDFDDLREQRPNYLLHLEKMQAQLLRQLNIYKALAAELKCPEFNDGDEVKGDRNRSASESGAGLKDKELGDRNPSDEELLTSQMEDVGKLVESATIESLCDALDACYQLLVSAWETPHSGRDCATSMCSLLRNEGLLSLLTANLATESIPSQLRLCSARLLSQVRSFEQQSSASSASSQHRVANPLTSSGGAPGDPPGISSSSSPAASRSVLATSTVNNNVESRIVETPVAISPE